MAGLYVFFGPTDRDRVNQAAGHLTFFAEETRVISTDGFSAAWTCNDDPALFAPASDPETGVTVITSGRIGWPESTWQHAEQLTQFTGGLSNRLLLERYLRSGASALERHNGPAALVLWDPRTRTVHLWTDHFGYHPVFLYRADDPNHTVISTFPEAIADDPIVSVSPDHVAMAEFLSAWRATPPHTYYREVKYAGPATHSTWNLRDRSFNRREYWKPFHELPFTDINAAAEELAAAVSGAVQMRTLPRLGPVVSYTSGGMDSRAVLFGASSRAEMIGLNLYDVPNKESAVAQRLCEAAGVRYVGFPRDTEYYPRWITEGVRLSGGMWSQEDNHFLGTRDLVTSLGARTVMTACTTDWLFKGYGLEKTYSRFLGRNLPISVLTDRRITGFLPNISRVVPDGLATQVTVRLEEHFAETPTELKAPADWLQVEDRRIRPACYAVSVSGQIMYRAFPYDTFLADARVADCYSRSQPAWKLNAELWGLAVRRICKGANHIEDSNFGWRVGSSKSAKLAAFARGWVRRRTRRSGHSTGGLATDGAWPNLGWYAQHSSVLRERWNSTPADVRQTIAWLWGEDPWATPLPEWAAAPNELFRILTLASHLARRPSTRQ